MPSFTIDADTHELHGPAGRVRAGRQVVVLAAALLRTPGKVVPYAAIAASMWRPPAVPPVWHRQSIRLLASKLRVMLAHLGAREVVQTLRSVGVCVVPAAPAHACHEPASAPKVPGLTFDPARMTVQHGQREGALGKQEAAILEALLSADGLVAKAELLAAMYPDGREPATANGALRVKLTQLRRKLRSVGVPVEIAATYGAGYRLQATATMAGA